MFKGFTKKFQEQLELSNYNYIYFLFSFSDLELVEVNGKKRKCRILSEEVSEKLHKLVFGGPKPTFVEFNTYDSFYFKHDDLLTFPNLSGYLEYIKNWLQIDKGELKK